jgi:hypothetical protein
VRVYAVSEQMSDEALELFVDQQMAELMVENWDRDKPDRAGELYVEPVELEASPNWLRPHPQGWVDLVSAFPDAVEPEEEETGQ